MTGPFASDILDQAIAWHVRLRDGDDDAWLRFTEWLEANPVHDEAYNWVADNDARLEPALSQSIFPEEPASGGRTLEGLDPSQSEPTDGERSAQTTLSRRWVWGAIAASFALVALFSAQLFTGPDSYTLQTRPGETRTIALADGSEIALNGGTSIILDRNDPRTAELVEGEAHFTVVHDEANPFVVDVAGRRLVDIGTAFNVTRSGDQLELEVSEGAVRFEGTSRTIELQAGEGLSVDEKNNIAVFEKSIDAMGSWTDGMLVYENATLAEIGGDIARATGLELDFSPTLRNRRFSGVIQTHGGHEEIRKRLEQLLDLNVSPNGDRWIVEP